MSRQQILPLVVLTFAACAGAAPLSYAQWQVHGAPVSTAPDDQKTATTASDGAGGMIAVWIVPRHGHEHLYAQRITAAGTIASGWPADGLLLSTFEGSEIEHSPTIISDGVGGAIVTWNDCRGGALGCAGSVPAGGGLRVGLRTISTLNE